jgi:hypothetical protein
VTGRVVVQRSKRRYVRILMCVGAEGAGMRMGKWGFVSTHMSEQGGKE